MKTTMLIICNTTRKILKTIINPPFIPRIGESVDTGDFVREVVDVVWECGRMELADIYAELTVNVLVE